MILVDGIDGEREGAWKFETTDEIPYIPNPIPNDPDVNCLKIISATRIGHTRCHAPETKRTIICEYEGNGIIPPTVSGSIPSCQNPP